LGVASALGTGAIAVNASSGTPILNYTGAGHSSDRNWTFGGASGSGFRLRNVGSGTLTLTGNTAVTGTGGGLSFFEAVGSNLELLGVISANSPTKSMTFTGSSGRTITLGGANTWGGTVGISAVTVQASVFANQGVAGSLGTGQGSTGGIGISSNGTLSYTGTGTSTNRGYQINNGTLSNNGSGALALTGTMAITNTATLGGSFNGAANSISGVISGGGALAVNGAGILRRRICGREPDSQNG
jgi:fibronectin-binding autotransporter adhesin